MSTFDYSQWHWRCLAREWARLHPSIKDDMPSNWSSFLEDITYRNIEVTWHAQNLLSYNGRYGFSPSPELLALREEVNRRIKLS